MIRWRSDLIRASGDLFSRALSIVPGFGRSFHELMADDLNKRMPEDARGKPWETLQRIISEGSGGLICIIL